MFYNVGGKIKSLAVVVCWVGIICSCVLGIMNISNGMRLNSSYYAEGSGTLMIITGVVIMVVGSLASWIGSLMTYGFGELVENSQKINENIHDVKEKLRQPSSTSKDMGYSANKSDLSKALNNPIATNSKSSESEELYKMLSECDSATAMFEIVKAEYPSYKNVKAVLKRYVADEESYGRSYKMEALGEAKRVLGL